jgi:PAS domain S-box-containing protein
MSSVSPAGSAILARLGRLLPPSWRPGPGIESRLLERKIALTYARLPAGIGMSLVVSSIVALLLPTRGGRAGLLLWGLASLALGGIRLADCLGFRRRPRVPPQPELRLARLVAGAAAQGLLWGFLGWRLFPAAPMDQLFLTLVMTGMAGGGIIFLAPVRSAYVLFLVPMVLPACVHLLAGALAVQKVVGSLGVIYVVMMIFSSAKHSRWMGDALRAAFDNEALVTRLQAANADLERHRSQLERVVEERTLSLSRAVAQLREEILDKEQERLRAAQSDSNHLSLLQAISEGFGHMDGDEIFLFANPAAEKIFGVPPGTLAGRSLLAFLDPAGRDLVQRETGIRRAGQGSRYLCPIVREDGERRLLEVNASPLTNGAGGFLGTSAVFEDITERKQAEDALRTALTFNDQIISSAHEGIIVYDLQGHCILWNRFMEALTGVPAEAVLGRAPAEVFAFADAAGITEGLRKGLLGEPTTSQAFPWSVASTGRSGWATSVHAPMLGSAGEIIGVVETVSDMTERKRLEQLQHQLELELHHSQKLESLGSLAGGIAHDMNNVLGAVQAMVQTLQVKHAAVPGLLPELAIIERASNRGRDLVKGLTNFVRKHLEEPELLDLNRLVREELELLGRTTLQRVVLVADLEEPLPPVLGERGALAGAIMNLCVNAMDAMADQGTLTLRTRILPAGEVGLSVQDTGAGMAPEVLARAMEPFFTTKAIGQGTGLGLAMVYATAKAHGGSVSLQSRVGQGTTVLVRLPAAAPAEGPEAPDGAPAQRPGPLRILQVDDDELILASIPPMLEQQGHTVATASGGEEALRRLAAGLEVDLVILDLNMPGLNGLETLRQLRELRPQLPVLLATGYLDPATEAVLARSGRTLGIAKPFTMDDLNTLLRKVAALG